MIKFHAHCALILPHYTSVDSPPPESSEFLPFHLSSTIFFIFSSVGCSQILLPLTILHISHCFYTPLWYNNSIFVPYFKLTLLLYPSVPSSSYELHELILSYSQAVFHSVCIPLMFWTSRLFSRSWVLWIMLQ